MVVNSFSSLDSSGPQSGLKVYQCSVVRRRHCMSVHNVQMSSETTWPFIIKLHIEHPLDGGTKVCINGQGHMTKMATIPIYGKNFYKPSSLEPGVYYLKLGMQHLRLKLYKTGINDDLRLTFTYFTAWSELVTCEF